MSCNELLKKITKMSFLLIGIFSSCKNQNLMDSPEELFTNNPVIIHWDDNTKDAESFCANVNVYTKNSRTDLYLEKTNEYCLSYKMINGLPYSRVDLNGEYNGGVARSVITNGVEMIVFNNDCNEVEARLSVPVEKNSFDFLVASPITGRMNVSAIHSSAQRLSLDLVEDNESGKGILDLPSNYFNDSNGITRLSTKVIYDLQSECLDEVEIVTIDEDGVTVTSTVSNVYEEYNGDFIKIGTITTIETNNPNKIEGFEDDYPVYESIDDIPEISDSELKHLQSEGRIQETQGVIFGDPADLSNVQTTVELYTTIDINEVEDTVFRMLLGE